MSLKRYIKKLIEKLIGKEPNNSSKPDTSGDAVNFGELDFCWGGFNPDPTAVIKAHIGNLFVTSSHLTYSWQSGGCENLGATNPTEANCLACLFCLIDGKWQGGKFDWISTSRTSRTFYNIRDNYHEWDKNAIEKADAFAFVIVSKDGKSRTNVIRSVK